MEPSQKNIIQQIQEELNALNQKLDASAAKFKIREEKRLKNSNPLLRNLLPRTTDPRDQYNQSYFSGGHNYLYQPQCDPIDQNERFMKNVRVEAPKFAGHLDPQEYLNWKTGMDHYFDWYDISKERKVKFAQAMLLGQAKLYWHNIQRMILQRR